MFLCIKSTTCIWWKVWTGQIHTVKRRSLSPPRLPSFSHPVSLSGNNHYYQCSCFLSEMDCASRICINILIDQSIFPSICLSCRSFILTQQRACMTSPLPLLCPPTWLCTLETVSKGKFSMGSVYPWNEFMRFPSPGDMDAQARWPCGERKWESWTPEWKKEFRLPPFKALSISQFLSFVFTVLKNLVLMANHWTARGFPSPSFLNKKRKTLYCTLPFLPTPPRHPH